MNLSLSLLILSSVISSLWKWRGLHLSLQVTVYSNVHKWYTLKTLFKATMCTCRHVLVPPGGNIKNTLRTLTNFSTIRSLYDENNRKNQVKTWNWKVTVAASWRRWTSNIYQCASSLIFLPSSQIFPACVERRRPAASHRCIRYLKTSASLESVTAQHALNFPLRVSSVSSSVSLTMPHDRSMRYKSVFN